MNIHCEKRENFEIREFCNASGLTLSVYENGGTRVVSCGDTMINQVEGHLLQGGFDQVFLRQHTQAGVESFSAAGASLRSRFSENGIDWEGSHQGIDTQVQLLIHLDDAVIYRVYRAQNTTSSPVQIDWAAGQDLGLSEMGALQSNEAYVCQYLDHKILNYSAAGRVVLTRNNLGTAHPMLVAFCAQGGLAASTDGFQFFGTEFKLNGCAASQVTPRLEDCVRQYEFAYVALQSEPVILQPSESTKTRFVYAFSPSHPPEDWRKTVYYHYYARGKHNVPRHDGIRTDRYKLIYFYTDDVYELYDLLKDPNEIHNVYGKSSCRDVQEKMKDELKKQRNEFEGVLLNLGDRES